MKRLATTEAAALKFSTEGIAITKYRKILFGNIHKNAHFL